jgi:segregation and condensation protein A
MREAAARLMARDRLGARCVRCGAPEGLRSSRRPVACDWFTLVQAYGQVKAAHPPVVHMVRDRPVMTLDAAIDRVSAMLGVTLDWMELRDFLPPHSDPRLRVRRSPPASSPRWNWPSGAGGAAAGGAFGPMHIRRVSG